MSTARTLEIFSARYEDDAKSGASYRDIGLDLWDTVSIFRIYQFWAALGY
jgi:hypothetical protein